MFVFVCFLCALNQSLIVTFLQSKGIFFSISYLTQFYLKVQNDQPTIINAATQHKKEIIVLQIKF